MNTTTRPIDRWFAHYSDDHRNDANQRIHVVCVPLILWSAIALLWTIPSPAALFNDGVFAGIAMLLAALFYYRHSRPLGLGMALVFVVLALATRGLYGALGPRGLLVLGVAVFVLAWIGQFVGHKLEGRKPSFLTDLTYLLIGPAWVLAKLYRRHGISY
ncbi:DUF962 domain-containing protein [Cognatilysobacter lacus]|uniref:DUF962 domain-containing protein n=1 Tax=Cognatilysobacter lacus TaxID=1643323 RepID=A0A5D8Z706_9GAMM|nr:Mpo1-like protein [Lysobacter lacus]TZF90457.1 DUF962 domain-containing protein [Lysobacter lacus]